jgi:hypothetical protein
MREEKDRKEHEGRKVKNEKRRKKHEGWGKREGK